MVVILFCKVKDNECSPCRSPGQNRGGSRDFSIYDPLGSRETSTNHDSCSDPPTNDSRLVGVFFLRRGFWVSLVWLPPDHRCTT